MIILDDVLLVHGRDIILMRPVPKQGVLHICSFPIPKYVELSSPQSIKDKSARVNVKNLLPRCEQIDLLQLIAERLSD